MGEKPRILVIDRDTEVDRMMREALADRFDFVVERTVARAVARMRKESFAGVYIDQSRLSAVRWAGSLIQADEILATIADGVAVVDPELNVLWCNPEFLRVADPAVEPVGVKFYKALGSPEVIGPDPCPFTTATASKQSSGTVLRVDANRYLKVTVNPAFDSRGKLTQMIALTRDITSEIQQEQKLSAIHKAGEELADLTPEELSELNPEERTDLLKYNIVRHMKDLMGLDFIEIRLLDRDTSRLVPLLTEGMTPIAAKRELFAVREGNGVTGLVAATGQSYLCGDTAIDPVYIEGAEGARSSLTVPLIYHGTVIGTLNVESPQPNAFDDRDRRFLEIYARSVASALTTLELLQAEKLSTATASVDAISRELALPLDGILSDATSVLDRYAGHDEEIIARLRHLIYHAREIRGLIQKVGTTIVHEPPKADPKPPQRLAGARLLVADSDESIRKAAHQLLGRQGAIVETARDAHEAIALARETGYSAALVDIRLPDMDGYETFHKIREVRPGTPVILMTGFGYDPKHSIVKARQEGLQTVLYKPFRIDRLMEAVEQAIKPLDGRPSANNHDPKP